jgi:hypothetical protein
LNKNELVQPEKQSQASSKFLDESLSWMRNHPVETGIAVVGATTVAVGSLAKVLESRALKSLTEAPVLEADLAKGTSSSFDGLAQRLPQMSTEELARMSHTLGENGLARLTITNIDRAAEQSAADFENTLDVAALGSHDIGIVKLPDDFDPIQALRERATAISRLAAPPESSSIQISWGLPSTQALNSDAVWKKILKN